MNGKKIKSVRESLGLRQDEFSKLFGIHMMTVSKWERGEAKPTSYQLGLISEFEKAGKFKEVKKITATLLISEGVMAVLLMLLGKSRN